MSVFDEIIIWQAASDPVETGLLVEGLQPKDALFVTAAHAMATEFYREKPPRKNGEPALTHSTNVAWFLVQARCQPYVIAAGLLHDIMEDLIDERRRDGVTDAQGLDETLQQVRGRFASDVVSIADSTRFPRHIAERVVEVVWVLTRHKADLYYKSISGIFTHPDRAVRFAAVLVKLADRMHNIETIDNYGESDKIYQCFKNLFILNNAKQLRSSLRGGAVDDRMKESIERLFKKCGKATFHALFELVHAADSGDTVFPLLVYLALALRKYMWEKGGLERVTHEGITPGGHVTGLYDGIVEKYDCLLHHEKAEYMAHFRKEIDYCIDTFSAFDLSVADLDRAVYFKDAMALMEVVAKLLYDEEFVIRGFSCSRLCRRGRNCLK